ncbi:MAG: prolyl oligopeptidase family serine peptidase [Deltaproteobacteria bacterium]|nr:prolyl oligopeptidase family serine peptidase [Deltaproteobacteria bacterium]
MYVSKRRPKSLADSQLNRASRAAKGAGVVVAAILFCSSCATTDEKEEASPTPSDAKSAVSTSETSQKEKSPLVLPGKMLPLKRIHEDPPLAGASPRGLSFSLDGSWLGFLRPSDDDSEVLDLWAYALKVDGNAASAQKTALVKTKDLVGEGEKELSEAEKMARERKRIKHKGIVSYQWCGKDSKRILFPLSGDVYVVTLPEKQGTSPGVQKLGLEKLGPRDAKCSASGEKVVFVSKREVWQVAAKGGKPVRLTKGATDVVSHGLSEFVAQEEMGRYTGHWVSEDARFVAYLEVDESQVSKKTRARITAEGTDTFVQRYPAAGETNAQVKIFVVDTKTKKNREVKIPKSLYKKSDTDFDQKDDELDQGYLPRVGWVKNRLVVQWQNRLQTRLVLMTASAPRFELQEILEEKDDAWVDLHDDLRFFTAEKNKGLSFLWPSEKSGIRQILRYDDVEGGLQESVLTKGEHPVLRISGLAKELGWLFTTRATHRSLEQHLFLTTNATTEGPKKEVQLTQREGTHAITLAKNGRFYVDKHSSFGRPPDVRLFAVVDDKGIPVAKEVAVLEENSASELFSYALPKTTFHVVKAVDGTELNAVLLEPVIRNEGEKVPVVTYTYGGPTAQVVVKKWSRLYPYFVHLTQRGFAVFMIDNRGSGNRERAFTRAMKNKFGVVEVEDQKAGAAWLAEHVPFIDKENIGIWGWSYGGYLSALAILEGGEQGPPWAAAASVAPVTDWPLYDTHYTERYVGTPQGNAAVYKASSVLERADHLGRPYLLVHGTADDNVLFDHSLKLMQRFQDQSLLFESMIYPGGAHSLRGRSRQLHVFSTLTRFFERELKPNVPAASAEGSAP